MAFASIRWRLQLWHTLLLTCLVTGMLWAFHSYERAQRYNLIDGKLGSLLTPLLPSIAPPEGMSPREDDFPPEERRGPGRRRSAFQVDAEFEKAAAYFYAYGRNGELLGKSSHAPEVPKPDRAEADKGQFFRTRAGNRELVYFGPDKNPIILGASLADTNAGLQHLDLMLIGLGFGIVLFGFLGGWWVTARALRPIQEISVTAQEIASGNRARRINVAETESELGQLAEVLNRTFDEQDKAFEQQVRFTADASHELRTPVTVILTQVQLALKGERDATEYKETLQACQRAAERMRGLVNSLLELARVDAGDLQLKMEECDLGAVASDSMELIKPLARERGATVRSSIQPVFIKADAARLGQVIVNLLYNAIQHNTREIQVDVAVENRGKDAVLRVTDNGAGISAEALPHIFERFYRADKSRTKNGSGLGLAISQAIVQAHEGTICAESSFGCGAVFTVVLPGAAR